LVFEKNANFFAENCQKSQKIVIITSTPGQVVPHPESLFEVLEYEGDDADGVEGQVELEPI
jgi:hypothetical protein